jgi:hypothetical protein
MELIKVINYIEKLTKSRSASNIGWDLLGYYQQPGQGGPRGGGGGGGPPGGGGPGMDRNQPSRTLWLGSLPPQATEADIRAAFAPFGMIDSVKVLYHKSCAFVNFVDLAGATNAYANAFNIYIQGQPIRVGWGKVGIRKCFCSKLPNV